MTKRNKILYWIATILIVLGTLPGGVGQMAHAKWSIDLFRHLGYPMYILTFIGMWKVVGGIVLTIPKFPLVKEWAYAGFFFAMSGAAFSHIASGDRVNQTLPSLVLLVLTVVSWYFRPANRRITSVNQ